MDLSSLSVLVVDDLSSARKVLMKLLQGIGFQNISEAKDGQDAFEMINQGHYSLVISDWEMPRLKGIELLQKVRSDERFRDLPFIMITANNNKQAVIDAAGQRVSDYIAKPFNQQTLAAKIKQLLEKNT